ncbi:MAG TPA: aminotransferase [Geoalkalibacter subterraneus]|uniref:Aminotransferase n=1 Tax=Geoalkalibacter subterraneus TaxID=483547 RepID=A0A831LJR0_9BACT|nr:aminotransferase [Geoalkalibacter subterraneus]
MKYRINSLIDAVNFPPISEVWEWVAAKRHPRDMPLIDLCQAVPSHPPDAGLVAHLKGLMDDPETYRYTPDEGLLEVREGLCAYYQHRYGAQITPDQLCLTIGASQAFWLTMVTLCRPGDEVVVVVPYYFDHVMVLDMLGIRSVFVPFDDQNGGIPDPRALASRINERTRALLMVTPSNPTGVVMPPEVLAEIHHLARKNDVALVLDETYQAFIPGGACPHDLFCDPDWSDHFIHIASYGKTFALTGMRAGVLAASPDFMRQALKAQDTMAVCAPRLTQQAILYGVTRLDGWVAAKRDEMQRRHDQFVEGFTKGGNPFRLVASGSFFAWVSHPFTGHSGRQVARLLLEEAGVLTLGGEVFGPALSGYLRIALGNITEDRIAEAVRRLREFPV